MEPDRCERALDPVDFVALFDQRDRDASRAPALDLERLLGELVPSRAPRPRHSDVVVTSSASPSGVQSTRSARCLIRSTHVGPSMGNQRASTY
jgi:hypothetical protein